MIAMSGRMIACVAELGGPFENRGVQQVENAKVDLEAILRSMRKDLETYGCSETRRLCASKSRSNLEAAV